MTPVILTWKKRILGNPNSKCGSPKIAVAQTAQMEYHLSKGGCKAIVPLIYNRIALEAESIVLLSRAKLARLRGRKTMLLKHVFRIDAVMRRRFDMVETQRDSGHDR
jgi:hypothetical protein